MHKYVYRYIHLTEPQIFQIFSLLCLFSSLFQFKSQFLYSYFFHIESQLMRNKPDCRVITVWSYNCGRGLVLKHAIIVQSYLLTGKPSSRKWTTVTSNFGIKISMSVLLLRADHILASSLSLKFLNGLVLERIVRQ